MKYVCFLLMLMLGSALLNSCEVDSSDNGDLDGFWHLESIDTLATGGICDYSNQRVFWGVQHKLLTVNNYKGESFNFRFSQTSDSLILSSPYKNHGHQDVENEVTVAKEPAANGYDGNPDNAYYQQEYYQKTGGKGVYGDRTSKDQAVVPKEKMSTGKVVLIVMLAILTFPLWVGIAAALFGIVVALFAVAFGLLLAFVAVAGAMVLAGGSLFVGGVVSLISVPAGGLCLIGASLILLSIGIVFIWLMVLIAAEGVPSLCRGTKALWNKIFRKGGKKA